TKRYDGEHTTTERTAWLVRSRERLATVLIAWHTSKVFTVRFEHAVGFDLGGGYNSSADSPENRSSIWRSRWIARQGQDLGNWIRLWRMVRSNRLLSRSRPVWESLMRRDLDDVIQGWPYDPEPGEVLAREVRARDGRSVLQVRVELGVLQLEMTGRPDGTRPHGFATYLDYLRYCAASRGQAPGGKSP